MNRVVRYAGIAAAVLFAAAVAGFGAALEGYRQAQYPVALLGAKGFPHALAFNLLVFVLPGMLAGVVAMDLRRRLPAGAGWPLRIGAQLVFLSALGFIAMGLLPLDPHDLESDASRFHGTVWMLWCVSFISGAVLLGAGLLRLRGWALFGRLTLVAMVGVFATAFLLTGFLPAGIGQRLAFALWFAWLILAGSGYGACERKP
ncbi:MAG: DUF998 domain-containing protein [Pseudoxanthomonas sp.]